MKKIVTIFSFLILGLIIFPALQKVEAHVVVKPNEVGIGTYQTFVMSVPNEKEQPVTKLLLVIPAKLESATPTVKNGWTITADKQDGNVKEIKWTEGVIPAGQRDDFSFSAKVPDKTATLAWKVYQTYQDGTVVAWDQEPDSEDDEEKHDAGPYSSTLVVDDLNRNNTTKQPENANQSQLPLTLSAAAIALAAFAFIRSSRK